MRPIALDMDGFASFRERTHVDFSDADFFALVGPTGSGKSTIIDAMTFALFGSVPRWGRKGMVSLALAPTISRGTVKLVFEVAGQRYVVARELRRIGSQVSQRAASLERLTDPHGLARPVIRPISWPKTCPQSTTPSSGCSGCHTRISASAWSFLRASSRISCTARRASGRRSCCACSEPSTTAR